GALAVEGKGGGHGCPARRLVLHLLLSAWAVDERMDRAGIRRPFGAQHLRGLARKGGELHIAVHMLREVARKRRLAGSGIAEKPEDLGPPFPQPTGDGFQRLVLLR